MLLLSAEAKKKYAELNSMAAKEIAAGSKDSRLLDLLNIIHDKYKVVQMYPNIGSPVTGKDGIRSILLMDGWQMLYAPTPNCIQVIDFVKPPTD